MARQVNAMAFINYCSLPAHTRRRVWLSDTPRGDIHDAVQLCIDPIRDQGEGLAVAGDLAYRVTGTVNANWASFKLYRSQRHLATIAVCLKARGSNKAWSWISTGMEPGAASRGPAQPPWVVTRLEEPSFEQPIWLHGWAECLGFGLNADLGNQGD